MNFDAGHYQQYPQLQKSVQNAPKKLSAFDSFDGMVKSSVVGSLPPVRRVLSLPDKFSNGDTVSGVGLAALMLVNFPEDCRDISAGYKQANAIFHGVKYTPSYDYTKYQHHFSFFKGTLIDEYVKKIKNPQLKKVMESLYNLDKSIYDTKLGVKIKKLLNITSANPNVGEVKDVFGNKMLLKEVVAPNKFAQITGRAMKRVTLLGAAALALIELPKILKAFFGNDENPMVSGLKQSFKSVVNTTAILAGIGYGGAICAQKFGPIGSLVGMGLGAVLGAAASNKIQSKISKD